MEEENQPSQPFLKHILFAGLAEIAELAAGWEVPYRMRRKLFNLASYYILERRGLRATQIMDILELSARTVSSLAKEMKQFDLMEARTQCDLPRRIELMLWSKPMSEGRMFQHLAPETPDDIRAAIDKLIERGFVERTVHPVSGVATYKLLRSAFRREDDGWFTRIDAVERFFQSMGRVLNARFLHRDERAMAGSFLFRMPPDGYQRLHKFYEEQFWPFLVQLENEASEDPEHAMDADLTLCWAPVDEGFDRC